IGGRAYFFSTPARICRGHPGIFHPVRTANVWVPMLSNESVFLSMYVGSKTSGMFLRGRRAADGNEISELMTQNAERLEGEFGPSRMKTEGYYYGTETDISLQEEDRWDELINWMEAQRCRYAEVLQDIQSDEKKR
ncbi:MAG: hypothetical protein OXQ31_28055, partial [Spirochaetaceae bacterium]|nr:hypothetical protein [Spirochaetaceae bacterium]